MQTVTGHSRARTKAETLEHIRSLGLENGQVLPLFYITYAQWSQQEQQLDLIQQWYSSSCSTEGLFIKRPYIVTHGKTVYPIVSGVVLIRSSTFGEDNNETSNAGKFLTLQNVSMDRCAQDSFSIFSVQWLLISSPSIFLLLSPALHRFLCALPRGVLLHLELPKFNSSVFFLCSLPTPTPSSPFFSPFF
jgi:hypothetical protein